MTSSTIDSVDTAYRCRVSLMISKHWFTVNRYRKVSNIRRTKSLNVNAFRLVLQLSLPNPLKPRVEVENEDVVGAAPTGDAPTTSEWSTILLPTNFIVKFVGTRSMGGFHSDSIRNTSVDKFGTYTAFVAGLERMVIQRLWRDNPTFSTHMRHQGPCNMTTSFEKLLRDEMVYKDAKRTRLFTYKFGFAALWAGSFHLMIHLLKKAYI